VEKHVIFYNQFVSLEELIDFLGGADFYVTPYLNRAQIVSGTLAYAVGAGKAVLSTPYWYAEEMLAEERGILVPFRDSEAIADHIIHLLEDEPKRHAMRKRAYLYSREMIWPKVVQQYLECFEQVKIHHLHLTRKGPIIKTLEQRPGELPPLKIDHLKRLTDDTGILQHAVFIIPNYHEGYTTDDNARALVLAILLEEHNKKEAIELGTKYLGFLWYAFNEKTKRFRNFLSYQKQWKEENGSDDCHGRALLALGFVLGRSNIVSFQKIAGRLFEQALPKILETTSPRAWAHALIGIQEYLKRFDGDRMAKNIRDELVNRIITLYHSNKIDNWHWFENSLSYCNAVLPHALMVCGYAMNQPHIFQIGIESLKWIVDIQKSDPKDPNCHFVPIGTNGFYKNNGTRARFDQQPIEAQTTVSACAEAYRITGEEFWYKETKRTFEWFLGRNDLDLPLYDATTGGCKDGLHPDRVNENQGAESTIAFLHSLLEIRLIENIFPEKERKENEQPVS